MSPSERRSAILDLLCERRHETTQIWLRCSVSQNVPSAVTWWLSPALTPIQTIRGRYGGIQLDRELRRDRKFLSPKQEALLRKLARTLQNDDLAVMKSILA